MIDDPTSSQAHVADSPKQKVKTEVFEAMSDPDVEKNEKGEVALHGRTVLYWTSSVPGAPLKEGG